MKTWSLTAKAQVYAQVSAENLVDATRIFLRAIADTEIEFDCSTTDEHFAEIEAATFLVESIDKIGDVTLVDVDPPEEPENPNA